MKNLFHSKHDRIHQSKEVKENEKLAKEKKEELKPADQKPEEYKNARNNNNGNNGDAVDLEGVAKKPLDDCKGCKDEVLGETDKAVSKPIT